MSSPIRRALVTGASSGLGVDFARQLAARGFHLVLTARRRDRLLALAEELRAAHRIEVECVDLDLGTPGAAGLLFERATAGGPLHALVNNAGFGLYEAMAELPILRIQALLQLNIGALTELSWYAVRHMRDHGEPGYVLNVASIAAYQPVPYFAAYGASKSYVRDFSEALAYEQSGSNVSVTCLCPGGTWTEFSEVAGQQLTPLAKASMMDSSATARIGLDAMFARRRNVVAGKMNTVSMFLTRLAPRRFTAWAAQYALGGRPPPPRLPA